MFDSEKKGVISFDLIGTILELLGHEVNEEELDDILDEFDEVNANNFLEILKELISRSETFLG